MSTVDQKNKRNLLHVLLTPLHLVERTRGRRRLALLAFYGLIAAVIGLFTWRAASLNGLPDVGDPFDVAAYEAARRVPPEEDANVLYERAIGQLKSSSPSQDRGTMMKNIAAGWSKASPEIRAWAGSNRAALATWRRGTERPRAGSDAVRDAAPNIGANHDMFSHLSLHWLALLEAARLEEAGDMAGAWGWYAADLRASRHVGMLSGYSWRSLGRVMQDGVAERATAWAKDPRTDAALLRRALADAREADAMTGPQSDTAKADYLAVMWAYDHPERWIDRTERDGDWLRQQYPRLHRAYLFFKREPERSQRVARIIFDHWIAHCDEPAATRPPMSQDVTIVSRWHGTMRHPNFPCAVAAGTPAAHHPIGPEALFGWMESSSYASRWMTPLHYTPMIHYGDQRTRARLILTLAEQCYRREHGGAPPSALGQLVGPYLDALPEGLAADGLPVTVELRADQAGDDAPADGPTAEESTP